MRYKSPPSAFQVFAVCGVNSISFGIKATTEARQGLLGFAVERIDPLKNERYFLPGFKVFPSVIRAPIPEMIVSTWEHPVQSFVWDDFSAAPDHEYEYLFYPIKGEPKNLDRSTPPVSIRVRTEPLFSGGVHDIFFNRGTASSQAYVRRFGNVPPDELDTPEETEEAYQWLSRELDEAIVQFIRQSAPGDVLRGCFYEFHYRKVLDEIKAAIDRGVDVQVIVDAKVNEYTDKKNIFHESFPRELNLRILEAAGIPLANIILRQARQSALQHNKFLVLVRNGTPEQVWTGSTNISLGGFTGQTNVGHWVRDAAVAAQYLAYWELLRTDPGGVREQSASEKKRANSAFRAAVVALTPTPTSIVQIPAGSSAVFSPRNSVDMLNFYVSLVDAARDCSCITLAFGIGQPFKQALLNNSSRSPIVFLLLEKRDKQNPQSSTPFVELRRSNNVYHAWGAYIKDPVYQWARETNALRLGLNRHVVYIHSKFLLHDPLGDDPIIVTGSANFSESSIKENDENMLIIRGDKRVADIYFTEFNRLFNHYYFRSVVEAQTSDRQGQTNTGDSLFLAEDADTWLAKYQPWTYRSKRLRLYTEMAGAEIL